MPWPVSSRRPIEAGATPAAFHSASSFFSVPDASPRDTKEPCAAIAFIPLLGWANWLIIPLAVIGAGIGAVSGGRSWRNLNLFVIVVCIVRLMLGGGIL